MGHRIAVLNGGRLQQLGTPMELYRWPSNLFVAQFIGSPPMNLLPGTVVAEGFRSGEQTLALPSAAPRQGSLMLGVRPEHAEIRVGGAWSMKVEMIEMLGAERLVYGRLGEVLFTVRLDGTLPPPKLGEVVGLHVPATQLHWFDDDGRRVE